MKDKGKSPMYLQWSALPKCPQTRNRIPVGSTGDVLQLTLTFPWRRMREETVSLWGSVLLHMRCAVHLLKSMGVLVFLLGSSYLSYNLRNSGVLYQSDNTVTLFQKIFMRVKSYLTNVLHTLSNIGWNESYSKLSWQFQNWIAKNLKWTSVIVKFCDKKNQGNDSSLILTVFYNLILLFTSTLKLLSTTTMTLLHYIHLWMHSPLSSTPWSMNKPMFECDVNGSAGIIQPGTSEPRILYSSDTAWL